MFRVPTDPYAPTFDHTEKVTFWRWFTSKRAERVEWARRRNAAAQLAKRNQQARFREWVEQREAERRHGRP